MVHGEMVQLFSALVTKTLYGHLHHVKKLAYLDAYVKDQGKGHLRNLQYLSKQYI